MGKSIEQACGDCQEISKLLIGDENNPNIARGLNADTARQYVLGILVRSCNGSNTDKITKAMVVCMACDYSGRSCEVLKLINGNGEDNYPR